MQIIRKVGLMVAVFAALALSLVPAMADGHDGPVVYPIDGAQFLPGVMFDMKVELLGEELPEDFAVTINGTDAAEFFGAEGEAGSFALGEEGAEEAYSSFTLRNLMFEEAGEYEVVVTANGETTEALYNVRELRDGEARNVILFIADGGSVGINTATRLLSRGIDQGFYNERLVFEEFEELGLLSTSGVDSIMTDSANSASSYNTGHKSSVNATGVYADLSPDAYDDPRVETFAELIKRTRGMSVGVVTTAYQQDATPAAVFGHTRERNTRSRNDFMLQAIGLEGSLGTPFFAPTVDVYLGGGAQYILPGSVEGSRRGDDRDVFAEYEAAGYTVVTTADDLSAAVEAGDQQILGTFATNNLNTWLDRNVFTQNLENETQPGLVDMVVAAIDSLSQNENGFYLSVEAASVDKALHPMDFERALADNIEFERSVAAAMDRLAELGILEETLIIVTADHAHSFDVFGTVDVEAFNAAETDAEKIQAIGIYAAAGFPTYEDADGDFYPDNWDVDVTLAMGKVENPPFTEDYQVSEVYRTPSIVVDGEIVDNPEDDPNGLFRNGNIPSTSSVHTLQDVPVYSQGPGAGYLNRNMENIEVFYAMVYALGLNPLEEGMDMMASE